MYMVRRKVRFLRAVPVMENGVLVVVVPTLILQKQVHQLACPSINHPQYLLAWRRIVEITAGPHFMAIIGM